MPVVIPGGTSTVPSDDVGAYQRVKLDFGTASVASAVSAANPMPITVVGTAPTHVDRSGTITLGGTAQVLAAANSARKGFLFQNVSAGDLWLNSLATAVAAQPSFKVAAGNFFEFPANGVPTGAISIIGATTAQAFSAREY